MSVEFNEENSFSGGGLENQSFDSFRPEVKSSWIVDLLLKYGIAKNEQQANYILIGITVLAFGLTLYVIFSGTGSAPNPGGAKLLNQMQQTQPIEEQ
jgi:hypothetical protein